MDGPELVFIVTPIVIPLVLIIGIALPFIGSACADRRSWPSGCSPRSA